MSVIDLMKEHYNDLLEVLDCIKVGIYIADSTGKTLLVNKESEKTGGLSREELIGRNMRELIEIGYIAESSILRALESGHEEDIIQKLGEGGQLYISGVPLFKHGEIEIVVCTERDITETINLKELLKKQEVIAEQYETELEYFRKKILSSDGDIVSKSIEMQRVIDIAHRVSPLDTTVLLTGESGTGKELIANYIYRNSSRQDRPYIKVNCAAIPETLLESEFFGYEKGSFTGADKAGRKGTFELAQNGTLFLDEIGDLPIQMQSKLLRVLQEKEIKRIGGKETIPIDVRIIAATNVDLKKAMENGLFRKDLYYRLNIIPIDIPPLRMRKDDIEGLAMHFIDKFNKEYGLNKGIQYEAVELLKSYNWPGNARELSNVIERIMVGFDGDHISKFQIQRQLSHEECIGTIKRQDLNGSWDSIMTAFEKSVLEEFLAKYHTAANVARALDVNKSTISRKCKKHSIANKG